MANANQILVTKDYVDDNFLTYGEMKNYVDDDFAAALKENASGEAFLLDDVSPVSHEMAVKVRGKNLFDNNKLAEWGLTLTDGRYMGSVSLLSSKTLFSNFTNNTQYTISVKGFTSTASTTSLLININYTDGTSQTVIRLSSTEEQVYSATSTVNKTISNIETTYYSGDTVNISYIQIEESTSATAYAPYISDLTDVKVTKLGKNLIPYPYVDTTKTLNGITFTDNGDGTITANGTATAQTDFIVKQNLTVPAGTYILSNYIDANKRTFLSVKRSGGNTEYYNNTAFNINDGDIITFIYIRIANGAECTNVVFSPQLELGSVTTEYEAYIPAVEYTPESDGTVDGVMSLYPNTTLMTDTAGAIIDCEYNADIKKYIDKKFAELTALVLEG